MSDMMWGGRFTKAEEKNALDFNASISYDCRMYREDIAGSIAHAKMLAAHGIISKEDQEKITKGLLSIKKEIDEGTFPFSVELEDIHMNIEKRLTEEIGDAGARLHTARSRNDQCALDLHMYMKRNIARLSEKLIAVLEALLAASKKYQDVILPGYTHMQRAQPVLFAHHMLAYFAMLERDFKRLEDCYDMCDMSPIARAPSPEPRTRPIPRKKRMTFTLLLSMETASMRSRIATTFSSSSPSLRSVRCTYPACRKNSSTGRPANSSSSSWMTATPPAALSCRRRRIRICASSFAAKPAASMDTSSVF